jgi:hypothetical protein
MGAQERLRRGNRSLAVAVVPAEGPTGSRYPAGAPDCNVLNRANDVTSPHSAKTRAFRDKATVCSPYSAPLSSQGGIQKARLMPGSRDLRRHHLSRGKVVLFSARRECMKY